MLKVLKERSKNENLNELITKSSYTEKRVSSDGENFVSMIPFIKGIILTKISPFALFLFICLTVIV